MPCISVQYEPGIGPLITVVFAPPGAVQAAKSSGNLPQPHAPISLLIDTGADITCVTADVAAKTNLRPMGKKPVGVASGSAIMNTYLADILIPFGDPTKGGLSHIVDNLMIMEYAGNAMHYQGLLGRDLICRGSFSISWDNRFVFCL